MGLNDWIRGHERVFRDRVDRCPPLALGLGPPERHYSI
jgi:hypothetical protein